MNQEKIKIEAFNDAQEIVNKYKLEKKRHSLKQKAFVKKQQKVIEEYENQVQEEQLKGDKKRKQKDESGENKFNQDRSIFDTKKGQVLFELQKSYKGDERFKLDKRFAEDIEANQLPKNLKQLTTGIDFQNLSDGSDYEFKKQSKQQKLKKKQEKQLLQAQNQNKNEFQQDNHSEEQEDQKLRNNNLFGDQNIDNDEDSSSDFFQIKQKKSSSDEDSDNNSSKKNKLNKQKQNDNIEEQNKNSITKKVKKVQKEDEIKDEDQNNDLDSFIQEDAFDDDGGIEFRKPQRMAIDYIDQEALEDEPLERTMEEELHSYLKILQDLMPSDKLFFQNKKKNLKINNNTFAGYGAMLSQEDFNSVTNNKKKQDKKKKVKNGDSMENGEGEGDEGENTSSQNKSKGFGFNKDFSEFMDENDEFGRQKQEKAYNLVIPRFDPSQLIVKKVMQSQERERETKLKELESKKKPKKISIEAKIEAGIDKKLKNIMKANSILDKNLAEHKKLEGIQQEKKKAPVLKKIKIDSDKWKSIIQEAAPQETEEKETDNKNTSKSIQSIKTIQPLKTKQQANQQQPFVKSNLGMLFATVQTQQDQSRSQFKLFG